MTEANLTALVLSLQLALVSTLLLLLVATPLAWWLARSTARWRVVVEVVVALPLVLPPTVLGFYLLLAFRPEGWLGEPFAALFNSQLAFSFTGLVIGSMIYSLPFVVQPIQNAFISMGKRPMELAATLGASPRDAFLTVAIPLAKPGFFSAMVLGFAHTLGEFGVVLMIGGSIPGETKVASIAIYQEVETLNFAAAHQLSISLLLISFVLLSIVYWQRRQAGLFK